MSLFFVCAAVFAYVCVCVFRKWCANYAGNARGTRRLRSVTSTAGCCCCSLSRPSFSYCRLRAGLPASVAPPSPPAKNAEQNVASMPHATWQPDKTCRQNLTQLCTRPSPILPLPATTSPPPVQRPIFGAWRQCRHFQWSRVLGGLAMSPLLGFWLNPCTPLDTLRAPLDPLKGYTNT